MTTVSNLVTCPMVFILFCNISQYGEVFKLMKIGQFYVFSAVAVHFLNILRIFRHKYCAS